ncbi:MAG: aldo/keto reductase [Bacteroidota bacterium]
MEKCKFSRLIAGTMTWGEWGKKLNVNQMVDLMSHFVSLGITSFDHADIYGGYTTEAEFGNAFAKSNIERSHVQFISKCGIQLIDDKRKTTVKHYNYNKEYILSSAENSLKHLKTDYLDILLLHRPSPLMHPEEIAEAISKLIDAGKIRTFGVSNFTIHQMELISKYLNITVNQIECSLSESTAMTNGTLDYLMSKGIAAMAWSPLGCIFKENTEQTKRIHHVLNELCQKYNAEKDQLLLAWLLKHPINIKPVLGTTTKDRIARCAKALEIEMELEDWFKLLEASKGEEVP